MSYPWKGKTNGHILNHVYTTVTPGMYGSRVRNMEEEDLKFTEEDERLLRQAMNFLKHRELMQEPFDGYWQDEDDV